MAIYMDAISERRTVAGQLREILTFAHSPEDTARRIERSCYNATVLSCEADGVDRSFTNPVFVGRYSEYVYRVKYNIEHSASLREAIEGGMDVNDIANLPSDQLDASANKAIRDALELRRQQIAEAKYLRACVCRCGSTKIIKKDYQARAADEGNTWLAECMTCGRAWRKG